MNFIYLLKIFIIIFMLKLIKIDVELSDALNYMVQHYYQGAGIVQESLDRLQQAFRCCGLILLFNNFFIFFFII